MNKLKLSLESLAVESFDTTKPETNKGTVFGEQCTCYTQCTCPGCPTCANYNTCDATCPATCVNTCDDPSCAGSCGGESCYETCGEYTCAFTCYDTCRIRICGGGTYGGGGFCPVEP
ncbi:MAG TPA: hypothetical protein VF006_23645 [Longimicrobium sp.]